MNAADTKEILSMLSNIKSLLEGLKSKLDWVHNDIQMLKANLRQ